MSAQPVPFQTVPAPIFIDEDTKNIDQQQSEYIDIHAVAEQRNDLLKSRHDELSIVQTVWVFRRVTIFAFMIYTLNMLDGWQISIAGTIVVNKGFLQRFGNPDETGVYALDTSWLSAWGAIINVGQYVAITFIPYVANRFGRKVAFMCCWTAFIICLIFLTTAKSPAVWLLGKLFVGIAAGSAQMTTGPYMVEIAPNRIRGGLNTMSAVWGSISGIICSAMLQVANKKYPTFYKLPIYVCWGLSGLMLAAILIVPESPWFYARHDNKEGAMKSMKRLYGNIPGFDPEEEYGIILRTLEHERFELVQAGATKYKDIFIGQNRLRTTIVTVLFTAQLLGGLAMISTYSTYFFSIAGLNDPFLGSLILSCVNLGTILAFTMTVDKIGRRRPVVWAYSFTSLSLWLIGALYYAPGDTVKIVLLVLTCIWSCAFTVVGNIYWLYAAELPSAHLRLKTCSFSLLIAASWGIITCFAVPPLLVHLNLRASFVFGATSLPCLIYLWFYLPETKGRAAAEIDELFRKKIPAWRWAKTTTVIEEQMHAVAAADRALKEKELKAAHGVEA